MRCRAKLGSIALIGAALLVATPLVGVAQPAPSPKPSSSARVPPLKASAGPAPSSSARVPPPAASIDPSAPLPPGHPQVPEDEDELPPGHPRPGGPSEDAPPGARGAAAPPQDGASDDPALPPGTVVVSLRDGDERPLAHAPIELGILRSTVTKGDSTDRRTAETDAAGVARFDDLPRESGYSYRLATTRGSASFNMAPFALNDRAGKRAVLHAYDSTTTLDSSMLLFLRAVVAVTLREEAVEIEQLVSVVNLGKVAWIADQRLDLPEGFKAFNFQDEGNGSRVDQAAKGGAALRGTFPPGQRDLVFSYRVPLNDEARQTFRIRLPERVTQARVLAEAAKSMSLEVRDFPPAQRVTARDGKHLLLTEKSARKPGEASTFDITLTGLPTRGPARDVIALLAVLAVLAAIAYSVQQARSGADPEAKKDLEEAREALIRDLLDLERARKAEEIGPKTYERVRASLLDALARILLLIDKAAPPAPEALPPSAKVQARKAPQKRRRVEDSP